MLKNSCLILIPFLAYSFAAWAQAPGGRSGIPNVTPAQTAAIVQMNADLASGIQALADARTAVIPGFAGRTPHRSEQRWTP